MYEPSRSICKENLRSWSKPCTDHILNFVTTCRSFYTTGIFSGPITRYRDEAKFRLYEGLLDNLKFQLPDCFKISCRRTRTRIFVEQKNPFEQQTSAPVPNHHLLLWFLDVFTPSDHKRRTTAGCSKRVQLDSNAAIFKEEHIGSNSLYPFDSLHTYISAYISRTQVKNLICLQHQCFAEYFCCSETGEDGIGDSSSTNIRVVACILKFSW